jgi:hypothetical protein
MCLENAPPFAVRRPPAFYVHPFNRPYAGFRPISRNFSYNSGSFICCLYHYYECSPKSLNQKDEFLLSYSVLKNNSADISIIFERLQKLCYAQNLVKKFLVKVKKGLIHI